MTHNHPIDKEKYLKIKEFIMANKDDPKLYAKIQADFNITISVNQVKYLKGEFKFAMEEITKGYDASNDCKNFIESFSKNIHSLIDISANRDMRGIPEYFFVSTLEMRNTYE